MRSRIPLLALAAALAAPGAALASAPPHVSEIHVVFGAKLEAKADDYGKRDLDALASDLKERVEAALKAKGLMSVGGAPLEIVITDAVPNRPTFAQLGRNPSLSARSIAVGGAAVEARVKLDSGAIQTSSYSWWENDIRNERGAATWSDADRAFDGFAHKLADGTL
jgi:hypothetical protein